MIFLFLPAERLADLPVSIFKVSVEGLQLVTLSANSFFNLLGFFSSRLSGVFWFLVIECVACMRKFHN